MSSKRTKEVAMQLLTRAASQGRRPFYKRRRAARDAFVIFCAD
jgi:hypothetical protein